MQGDHWQHTGNACCCSEPGWAMQLLLLGESLVQVVHLPLRSGQSDVQLCLMYLVAVLVDVADGREGLATG